MSLAMLSLLKRKRHPGLLLFSYSAYFIAFTNGWQHKVLWIYWLLIQWCLCRFIKVILSQILSAEARSAKDSTKLGFTSAHFNSLVKKWHVIWLSDAIASGLSLWSHRQLNKDVIDFSDCKMNGYPGVKDCSIPHPYFLDLWALVGPLKAFDNVPKFVN